ncbi:SnoaL-like protein [Nonomuraea fuscirosea]|uniref:SnoaL-like protein n=1 Tax=Nonomuraea fuscirosea TaxID=1291556 RepID=A0A2T0MMQ7_9ACTN|nr:nuclear transport factor 2 family protein [Nonomuraea fuscirosea]PRX59134.1 SnoaL-like protein [Nonomuraea fuscirosea]
MSHHLKEQAIGYLRSLEKADWVSARSRCAGTATVWHNDGTAEQGIEENIRHMAAQADAIESMRYDVIRQFAQPGEVLQQHVVHVAMRNGMRGEVHAAVYFRFDDAGLITRIEEYAGFVPAGGDSSGDDGGDDGGA